MSTVFYRPVFQLRALTAVCLMAVSLLSEAVPVCSTGSDGIVTISAADVRVRVNSYYAAPDPAVSATTLSAGETLIPVDTAPVSYTHLTLPTIPLV